MSAVRSARRSVEIGFKYPRTITSSPVRDSAFKPARAIRLRVNLFAALS